MSKGEQAFTRPERGQERVAYPRTHASIAAEEQVFLTAERRSKEVRDVSAIAFLSTVNPKLRGLRQYCALPPTGRERMDDADD